MTKLVPHSFLGALIVAGAVVAASGSASAAVVCNASGSCWHTHHRYHYPPRLGLVVHDDHWRWRDHHAHGHVRYHWHEHAGRGYWRNGIWITF